MGDVTKILEAAMCAGGGDGWDAEGKASGALLVALYEDLRALVREKLAGERAGQTLQATALVHEAYLRLGLGSGTGKEWEGRAHFFGAAAEAMRRILIENASARGG